MEKVYYDHIPYMDEETGENIAVMYKDFASKGVLEIFHIVGMDDNDVYWFSKETPKEWFSQLVDNVKIEGLESEAGMEYYQGEDIRFLLADVKEVIIDGVLYINLSPPQTI
jgi:hypothetical protein